VPTRPKTVVSKNANAPQNRFFILRNKAKDGFFFYLNFLTEQNRFQLIVFSVKRKNSNGQVVILSFCPDLALNQKYQ
jgi:hypothetical protein